MFKVFSFVIIFISFSVFAHPDISKKRLEEERQNYQGVVAESKRLKDRVNIFCRGYLHDPILYLLTLEENFKKACGESNFDGITEIREKRNDLLQRVQEIQNNSPEYREFYLLFEEYKSLDYDISYFHVLNDDWSTKEKAPKDVYDSAKKVSVARHRWEQSAQFNSWRKLLASATRVTKKMEAQCKEGAKQDKKIWKSVKVLESTRSECVTAKDEYLSYLPQVYDARKKFEEMGGRLPGARVVGSSYSTDKAMEAISGSR